MKKSTARTGKTTAVQQRAARKRALLIQALAALSALIATAYFFFL